jgi:enoyl-CoA hydratase/carnithine racemase
MNGLDGDNAMSDVNVSNPSMNAEALVRHEVSGRVGCITLNRPKALNALSLDMVRLLTNALLEFQNNPQVLAVLVRGQGKEEAFGHFCAGGDIRFFHQAALAGDDSLGDFFTEEYALNHLIHTYSKPYLAFMDGVVMGGGMGISQGASVRIVTDRTQMAMPETHIGLFPDVGGGYFLSRCPGYLGEYLGLTGQKINGHQAILAGLADGLIEAQRLPLIWKTLLSTPFESGEAVERWVQSQFTKFEPAQFPDKAAIDKCFALSSPLEISLALEQDKSAWALQTLASLNKASPLMVHVVLAQIRKARSMGLADDLRMERDMVHHCFHLLQKSETVEGIRALAIDKDHHPKWAHAQIADVAQDEWPLFFESPWTPETHPLRHLN